MVPALKVPVRSFGTGTFGGKGQLFATWGGAGVDGATRLVDICLVGARNEQQLRQNLDAVGWNLSPDQVARLDTASLFAAAYPYWHQHLFKKRNPFPTAIAYETKAMNLKDRAAGAVMGALIGDALGLGPHWYYDLEELRRDYGAWITGYTDPKPHRYHGGMKAGQLSQAGIITLLLLDSTVEQGAYDEADFCSRLDRELFPLLDGEPHTGPGGYTSQSMREAWRRRVRQGMSWQETGGPADTTEAAERIVILAARHAGDPALLARAVTANAVLTQNDDAIVALTTAFGCVLGQLVAGERFTPAISDRLMELVKAGKLPFHRVTSGNLQPPKSVEVPRPRAGTFASPDALLLPGYIAEAALDPGIQIEPAWKVSTVYGLPCAIYHQLPAAYYLAARFHDDFESAVLHAINGGGQNQARAILTGALVGAQVGLSGIPSRFLEGLENAEKILGLAQRLGDQAAATEERTAR